MIKKQNFHNEEKINNMNKQIVSIPIFPVIILCSIIIIFFVMFFQKASICDNSNNIESNIQNNNSPEIANEQVEEESEQVKNDEQENTSEDKLESKTYTASNGEKYDIIAKLNIPSLEIEYPILSTTSKELLKVALNKYWGANPNEVGNMVVVGHNYEDERFFGKLPQIQKGEFVKITDLNGKTLDYEVYDTFVIDPYDNKCTSQLTNGRTEITLITCYNGGKDRFVVKARSK